MREIADREQLGLVDPDLGSLVMTSLDVVATAIELATVVEGARRIGRKLNQRRVAEGANAAARARDRLRRIADILEGAHLSEAPFQFGPVSVMPGDHAALTAERRDLIKDLNTLYRTVVGIEKAAANGSDLTVPDADWLTTTLQEYGQIECVGVLRGAADQMHHFYQRLNNNPTA